MTELLRGGELLDKLLTHKRFSEREAADVIAVLAETMAYLHRNGVSCQLLQITKIICTFFVKYIVISPCLFSL